MADDATDGLPVIPPLPPGHSKDMPGNPAVAKCGECGRVIYEREWYVCANYRCPVQIKPRF